MRSDLFPSKRTEQLEMAETWRSVRIRLGLENSHDRDNNTENQNYQNAEIIELPRKYRY